MRSVIISCVVLALLAATLPAAAERPERAAEEQLEMGYEAARRGYWQEALDRFEDANRLDPGNAEVLNNMAVAYEAVGRWDDARVAYEQAMQLDPTASRIRKNYQRFEDFYASFVARPEPGDADDDSGAGADEEDRDER